MQFALLILLALTEPGPASAPESNVYGKPIGGSPTTHLKALVKDLNHPQRVRREKAALRLMMFGPTAIPALEETKGQEPFESQVAIEQVLRDLRCSKNAVLVAWVNPDKQAGKKGIQVGDVFLSVDGHPTLGVEALDKAEKTDYRRRSRKVRVRRTDHCFDVPFEPGEYGIHLCEFGGEWGRWLVLGIRAAQMRMYTRSLESFRHAKEAGADLETDSILRAWWSLSSYYGRPATERDAWFADFVKARVAEDQEKVTLEAFRAVAPFDQHIVVRLNERIVAETPDAGYAHQWLATEHAFKTRQYPQAIVSALKALDSPKHRGPEHEELALYGLASCLIELGAEGEFATVLHRLAEHPLAARHWHRFTSYALNRPELRPLSRQVLEKAARRRLEADQSEDPDEDDDDTSTDWTIGHLLRIALLEERYDTVDSLLLGMMAYYPRQQGAYKFQVHWQQSSGSWDKYGQLMAARPGAGRDRFIRYGVMEALTLVPAPNLEAIDRVLADGAASEPAEALDRDALTHWQGRAAGLHGNYAEAIRLFESVLSTRARNLRWKYEFGSEPELDGVRFLQKNSSRLTGEAAHWLKTIYAFPSSDGHVYLVTREHRIGYSTADGSQISEIPHPEPAWWPRRLDSCLLVSSSGRIVLSPSWNRVYRLNADRRGWTLLTPVPERAMWELWDLRPWLDELVPELEKRSMTDRELVMPRRVVGGCALHEPMLLRDGTCLLPASPPGTLVNLSEGVAQAAGRKVRIYDWIFNGADPSLLYLATDQGLFKWSSNQRKARPISLPNEQKAAPLRILLEELREAHPRSCYVAAFPDAGGQIYRLDMTENKLTTTERLNATLPLSYWRLKPTSERIGEIKTAVQKAGLVWPAASQTAPN